MSIIYCKEWGSWPDISLFKLRLYNIQYNTNSIFIIIPNHSLMCVCSISYNYTIPFRCIFSWVVLWFELLYLHLFHLNVLFFLLQSHFHTSILNNVWVSIVIFIIKHHYLRLNFFHWKCRHRYLSGFRKWNLSAITLKYNYLFPFKILCLLKIIVNCRHLIPIRRLS